MQPWRELPLLAQPGDSAAGRRRRRRLRRPRRPRRCDCVSRLSAWLVHAPDVPLQALDARARGIVPAHRRAADRGRRRRAADVCAGVWCLRCVCCCCHCDCRDRHAGGGCVGRAPLAEPLAASLLALAFAFAFAASLSFGVAAFADSLALAVARRRRRRDGRRQGRVGRRVTAMIEKKKKKSKSKSKTKQNKTATATLSYSLCVCAPTMSDWMRDYVPVTLMDADPASAEARRVPVDSDDDRDGAFSAETIAKARKVSSALVRALVAPALSLAQNCLPGSFVSRVAFH